MSRIGMRPIPVPKGVEIKIGEGALTIKGPKGELSRVIHPDMVISQDNGTLKVERPSDSKEHRSLHGLTRTLVANMIEGVSNGYRRVLEVHGVGFRAQMSGKNLTMTLGYSHAIELAPTPGIEFEAGQDQQTRTPFVVVKGIDKELVGRVAAQVRSLRKPEPYKGKGVRYQGEQIRRKAGKAGKAGAKGGGGKGKK